MSAHPRWKEDLENLALFLLGMAFVSLGCFFLWLPGALDRRERRLVFAKATLSQLTELADAVDAYDHDNGRPPTTGQGLAALLHRPNAAPLPKRWRRYLIDSDVVPRDPWGNGFLYRSPGPRGERYWLCSYGADERPGGRDRNQDVTIAVLDGKPPIRVRSEPR